MKKQIEITPTPKELAEMLFELDNEQVAQMFSHWKKLFDENYEEAKRTGENIWIFDLNHFFMYVAKRLDDDGIDFFRSAYSSILYTYCDNIAKKHLLKTG